VEGCPVGAGDRWSGVQIRLQGPQAREAPGDGGVADLLRSVDGAGLGAGQPGQHEDRPGGNDERDHGGPQPPHGLTSPSVCWLALRPESTWLSAFSRSAMSCWACTRSCCSAFEPDGAGVEPEPAFEGMAVAGAVAGVVAAVVGPGL